MDELQNKVLQLLDSHGEPLHRLLGRLTRCEHATSDLMQDMFIRLSTSKGFARADNPYAYAWKTATNLAFQWQRQRKSYINLDQTDLPYHSKQDAVEEMIRHEHLDLVLLATAKLSQLARNVIVMRYIENQSYENIAQRLKKNPDHMRSLCSKSLKKLKKILQKQITAHTDREVGNG